MSSPVITTHRMRIAYLGPDGSFSSQAAKLKYYGPEEYRYVACSTIKEVLATIESGGADKGVVPFENSSNGSVSMTLDMLLDPAKPFPSIVVGDEIYLPIRHFLLGLFPDKIGIPLTDLTRISRVFSHPQAFGQCERFLGANLSHATRHETSSTAQAAAVVFDTNNPDFAALASEEAKITPRGALQVLAANIEDDHANVTRFLVFQKAVYHSDDFVFNDDDVETRCVMHKALLMFRTDFSDPTALGRVLEIFRGYGLDIKNIQSRPGRVHAWSKVFFVEYQGTMDHEGVVGHQFFIELRRSAVEVRFFGFWPRA
ncbi:MAG: prephenate dehydratase [Trizodia sp. TS-e1964]|nr:MAG: prephenate dehydratase [Trizodia sp. TS-e1964]